MLHRDDPQVWKPQVVDLLEEYLWGTVQCVFDPCLGFCRRFKGYFFFFKVHLRDPWLSFFENQDFLEGEIVRDPCLG